MNTSVPCATHVYLTARHAACSGPFTSMTTLQGASALTCLAVCTSVPYARYVNHASRALLCVPRQCSRTLPRTRICHRCKHPPVHRILSQFKQHLCMTIQRVAVHFATRLARVKAVRAQVCDQLLACLSQAVCPVNDETNGVYVEVVTGGVEVGHLLDLVVAVAPVTNTRTHTRTHAHTHTHTHTQTYGM